MLGLVDVALGIAEFVPSIARFLGGDKVADVAEKVVGVARQITGIEDPEQALEKIRADAQLQISLQQAMTPVIIAQYEAEARQLESINATMRAEAASNDKVVRRWRPFLGYVVAATWGIQMLALSILIVAHPKEAPAVIAAMASLSAMWGVALSILGISVSKRSQDKQVAAGQQPAAGVLSALANRFIGNKHDTTGKP